MPKDYDVIDFEEVIRLIKAKVKELGGIIRIITKGLHCGVEAMLFARDSAEQLCKFMDEQGWDHGNIVTGNGDRWRIHLDEPKNAKYWQTAFLVIRAFMLDEMGGEVADNYTADLMQRLRDAGVAVDDAVLYQPE